VPAERIAYWDEATHAFVIEPDEYRIFVGASSDDIRVESPFNVVEAQNP